MHDVTQRVVAQPCPPPSAPPAPTGNARALYVEGLMALRDGRANEAVGLLGDALGCEPGHQGMRRNLVRALLVAERFGEVATQAEAALALAPNEAELHFALGTALSALGRQAAACSSFARALSLQPEHAACWLNMGNAAADLDDLGSAEALCRTAIRLDGALAEAHASLGYILTMQGRLGEATEACEAAIRLRPDFAQAHWNLAIALLLSGDLPRGFAEYEWRKRHARFRSDFPDLPGAKWDGSSARGQTILVRAEQGLGDAIQFARYLPLIHAAGGRPVLLCAPSLVPLLGAMPGVDAVASPRPLPAYDAWIDQISLPRVFGTTLDGIPAAGGYLSADPVRKQRWFDRLPASRKVGIVLAGNPGHRNDRRRSIPPDLAVTLLGVPGVALVSLQHGRPVGGIGLPDLTRWMGDYAETAALIAHLDLVITVDTSVAHLAGAMGKPVWVLLAHAPDWRWLLKRIDSPWYQSARLFRQASPGDWEGVLAEVKCALNGPWG